MYPAHFIRLLTILPTIQALVSPSSRWGFILRLSTLLTPAILLIQLFSHNCSLRWCSSDRTNVSKPQILAGTTQESRTFLFSFLEIFLSTITPSTFLHAFAPDCILRRTATPTRPFAVLFNNSSSFLPVLPSLNTASHWSTVDLSTENGHGNGNRYGYHRGTKRVQ